MRIPPLLLSGLLATAALPVMAEPALPDGSGKTQDYRRISAELAKSYQKSFDTEIAKALTKGASVAEAVCREYSQSLAKSMSRNTGAVVRRVSEQYRNPLDKPSDWESEVLRQFLANHQNNVPTPLNFYEETDLGTVRYMSAIKTQPNCLNCHSKFQQPVAGLEQSASRDKADIRGAVSIEWKLQTPKGLDANNLKHPNTRVITAGQPSKNDYQKFKGLGIDTVINLRPTEEQPFAAQPLAQEQGLAYVEVPTPGAAGITLENATALKKVLDKAAPGRIFIHCASGNRVGALLALKAHLDGASNAEALAIGKASGLTSLTPTVEKLLNEQKP